MSRNLLTLLVSVVALTVLAGGCERIKQLEMTNKTLSMRLETAEGERDLARSQNAQLQQEMAELRKGLGPRDQQIEELEQDRDAKIAALLELQKKYDALANQKRTIGFSPLPAKLNTALSDFAKKNPDLATFDEKYGMVKFKSDLTFPSGSAVVKATAADPLQKLVEILNTPDASDFAVYIAGHTDDMPISKPSTLAKHPTNWYLSAHRAVGVQKVLAKFGLAPKRIAVMGFGEYHPIEPNKAGKKGNPANRRVEIWIVPKGQFLTAEK